MKKILAGSGGDVFVAEHSIQPGQPLTGRIINAIKGCDLFVLLWGENSKQSEWVQQEIAIAAGTGKTIVPILVDGKSKPPGFLKGIKYLSAGEDPGAAMAWLRRNVFESAQKKARTQGLIWLGLGGLVIYALNHES